MTTVPVYPVELFERVWRPAQAVIVDDIDAVDAEMADAEDLGSEPRSDGDVDDDDPVAATNGPVVEVPGHGLVVPSRP